ncbi:T9SS type A sorting domain-containing protein [uncultured Psychroserpens sp.]|uniref:T9SS type A sorting domain-containing protein n=1 Tax=uncultured Psychroserpens sp. TaxID=255436 RepID=UPI00261F5CA7|nr:T9SS type A sorting domain-containing protein [uncultured Psychroserpens sp.]
MIDLKKITLSILLLVSLNIAGQNIAAFSGTATPQATAVNNLTAEALTRGSGLTALGGATFNSGAWTANTSIDPDDYIEWTITAAPNFSVNITGIDINYDRDPDGGFLQFLIGSGPAQLRLRSSLDNYNSDLFSDTNVSNAGEIQSIVTNLNSTTGGSITFRLYGFESSAGLFGSFGSLDIEGGLGTVLSLDDTGIVLKGTVISDGLIYSNSEWTPNAPSASTGTSNALVLNGTYTETSDVAVNDLIVNPGASIIIEKTGSLTVNGNLTTNDAITLESDSDEYSSLIVNGSVTGSVFYNRHVNTNASSGGNDLISPPVSGQTFGAFASVNSNIFFNPSDPSRKLFGPFNKTTGTYQIYDTDLSTDANTTLDAGVGYRAASTDNGNFLFSGVVNTSSISQTILDSGPQFEEWNLIGNPYTSYIRLSDFLTQNNSEFNVDASGVYGYDGNASDGWTIWNLAYSTLNPNALITPGQGFLVATKPGGGSVTFNPSMRSSGNTDDFILGRNDSNVGYFRLKATSNSNSYTTDFYFIDNTSLGLDPGYDASIFGGNAPNFSIYSQLVNDNSGIDMGIQSIAFSDVTQTLSVPLGVNANTGQQVTISIEESTLPDSFLIYLEDNVTNTFTLLNINNYVFTANTSLRDTGRFFLHYAEEDTLSINENYNDNLQMFATSENVLYVKGLIKENTILHIYDVNGRLITQYHLSVNSTSNSINMKNISAGFYVAKLKNNLQEKTLKLIVR